jgi:hypothetical protein
LFFFLSPEEKESSIGAKDEEELIDFYEIYDT